MQRKIQRTHLLPQPLEVSTEIVRRHVIPRAPQRAGIFESHFARALIRKLNESRIPLPHGRRNRMPSSPNIQQLVGIAAGRHDAFDRSDVQTIVWLGTIFTFPIISFERSADFRQLAAQHRVLGGRRHQRQAQQFEFPRQVRRHVQAIEPLGLFNQFRGQRRVPVKRF